MKTDDNVLIIDIEGRDLLSDFMFGMKGLYSTRLTWNDLMPVVEKIEGLDEEYTTTMGYGVMHNLGLSSRYCFCYIQNWHGKEIAGGSGTKTLIESVHNAVIQFIKFYNENSSKEK